MVPVNTKYLNTKYLAGTWSAPPHGTGQLAATPPRLIAQISNQRGARDSRSPGHHLVERKMEALQLKVDSISGEVSQISDALRGYLDHGIASGRRVQPPRTKAGRDLLQHLLGRLDQVSTSLAAIPRQQQEAGPASGSEERPQTPATDPRPRSPSGLAPPARGADTVAGPADIMPGRHPWWSPAAQEIRLTDGSVYRSPVLSEHASPLFDCTYQDIRVLNEELFELYSSHPVVRDRGYFKLQVRGLPPLNVQKVARPGKDHATSFCYKVDCLGLVKVDTGKRCKFSSPRLPLPMSAKMNWSLAEQRHLWNSSAADPPKGSRPYIIGNPLFDDVELSPGEKLRRRGRTTLEGINTQYVYFNLTGKTITTMHREDAHVRSENLLRSGQHKFWCLVKPAFARKLEERMALEYPEMRRCSQAVRHLSRHIPPARLDEWGIEYTLDYCVPGQAIVTEPGTYHQVLNLGPNYAIAINLEYSSSPDMPPDYRFCDRSCPDKFAISADDFRIYKSPPTARGEELPRTPETVGSKQERVTAFIAEGNSPSRPGPPVPQPTQSATPPPEQVAPGKHEAGSSQLVRPILQPPDHLVSREVAQEDDTPVNLGTEKQALLLPPDGAAQPEPLPSPPVLSSVLPAGQGVPPGREAARKSTPQAQLLHRMHMSGATGTPPAQTRSSALQFPAAAPAQLAGFHQQSQSPGPEVAARSPWLASCRPSPIQSHDLDSNGHHRHLESGPEGLPPILKTGTMTDPKRKAETPSPKPAKRQRIAPQPAQEPVPGSAFEHLAVLIRGRQAAKPGKLTPEKLCSKLAFERLAHLVREWRRYCRATPVVLGGLNLFRSVEETSEGYPGLHAFLSRLFKMKLAEYFEETTASGAPQQSSQDVLEDMLRRLRWDGTERHKLHDFLREGKCWRTLCGKYDGLLCLMPTDADCFDLALFKDQVARLHAELDTDFVHRLCAMGRILQRSIWEYLELPEFIWEATATTWLSAEQIYPLLAPFRLIKSNYYDPHAGYHWPRPAGWHWDWPADPTSVRPGDRPCSFCTSRKSCRCIETKVPQVPRISDDWGTGIRSVGPHRANDILGELVGELIPVGACNGDWAMELRRPDLDDLAVAEIYPRRMGNWVRKVNHSTNPSAVFKVAKVSGRWRQLLVATRDISDGEEITAKYGRGFFKEQPYSLVEGLY